MLDNKKKISSFDDLINSGSYKVISAEQVSSQDIMLSNGLRLSAGRQDCLVLSNATIMPAGLIVDEHWLADTVHYMPVDWVEQHWLSLTGRIREEHIEINEQMMSSRALCKEDISYMEGTYFMPDIIVGHKNFGHFLHDTCSSYKLLRRAKDEFPDIKLLFIESPLPNINWSFDIMYAHGIDVIRTTVRPLTVETLIVPRRQAILGNLISDQLLWQLPSEPLRAFSESARARLGIRRRMDHKSGLKIYIHRHQPHITEISPEKQAVLQGRYFIDIEKSITQLVDAGFVVVEPARLSQSQLIAIMSDASCVVGLHGAGLCNAIFSYPETKVYEIRQMPGTWLSVEALLKASGLAYQSINYEPDASLAKPFPLEQVLAAIE